MRAAASALHAAPTGNPLPPRVVTAGLPSRAAARMIGAAARLNFPHRFTQRNRVAHVARGAFTHEKLHT